MEHEMSVYLIVDVQVVDTDGYAEYVEKVADIVTQYGGRYLARGGKVTVLSGNWRPQRIILIEFPSRQELQKWLASPEYASVSPLRERSTRTRAIVVEGVSASSEGTK
ncbi:MAG: DUF1330 domain-containing protein [Candidatus Abyssobacteria bacterium SURF_17]|jgi:uncharacterized protein (DUF1330 family)|uniref:DUF1330 domain-containing protein n=1 Tax=Candidatus Abyssobacteria bacterium SURF_17 TaxID=2093361 RepID=A0A419F179_9BACT|nr:MAG: DUF1330 domain-containing protein [Candidatus Abyssubacteria bacterium SURF_17]